MDTAADEALLAGIAEGDAACAAELLARYQRRVFGLALTVLRDRHAAEDVAQEAFVRIWRHAGAFDPRRGAVAGWILTIARNAAIDVARLRRASVVDPASLVPLSGAWTGPSPEDEAERDEAVIAVRSALATLPAHQREAVLLAAFYGRTAAEVAARQQVPLGTAKTRIRDGLRKLRAELSGDAEGSDEVLR